MHSHLLTGDVIHIESIQARATLESLLRPCSGAHPTLDVGERTHIFAVQSEPMTHKYQANASIMGNHADPIST